MTLPLRKKAYKADFTINVPRRFTFIRNGEVDFSECLHIFDWNLRDKRVLIDFSRCQSAGYSSMSLFVLYCWWLEKHGCDVQTRFRGFEDGVGKMWRMLGARGWRYVLASDKDDFRNYRNKLLKAIRSYDDFNIALQYIDTYIDNFDVSYSKSLRHIISETVYNTIEHGKAVISYEDTQTQIPSLININWLEKSNEIQILVADVGIGIRKHLKNYIPDLEDDVSAILKSIEPKISGTFGQSGLYKQGDNAGMGLYMSSNLARNLRADMYIISGNGKIHVSPKDLTHKTLEDRWPGTIVFIKLKLKENQTIDIEEILEKIRQSARDEVADRNKQKAKDYEYFVLSNYFGRYAENKGEAINFRDRHLLPALRNGKSVKLDFTDILVSPHSFLNALLSTAVKELGEASFRRIKTVNAISEINDTVDYIFEDTLG
ncbi:STAS-like domain-containing protein [Deinococcus wulumuqiensis]